MELQSPTMEMIAPAQAGQQGAPPRWRDDAVRLSGSVLLYRWAALAAPFLLLVAPTRSVLAPSGLARLLALSIAVSIIWTGLWLVRPRWLSHAWTWRLDLIWMAGLLLVSGRELSPFILHSFAPVFAAALLAGPKGGVLTGAAYSILLAASAGLASPSGPQQPLLLVTYAAGVPLVSALIGVVAQLWRQTHEQAAGLARLSQELAAGNRALHHTNQQLALLRQLTLALEEAVDPEELQEQLLAGLVDELGFRRAVVALYDPSGQTLSGWLARGGSAAQPVSHMFSASAAELASGPVGQALLEQRPVHATQGQAPSGDPPLDALLAMGPRYSVYPLTLRGETVGLLLVDWSNQEALSEADQQALDLLVHHAGVALGSLRLCIGRAQVMAVTEERTRIASDIHDTVSQSLFGLAYGLNACAEMLPDEPEAVATVKKQLQELQPLVFDALQQIRGVVMDNLPEDLTRERFAQVLDKQINLLTLGQPLTLEIDLAPEFDEWPQSFRQQLLLIAYEGLANVARHAGAQQARLSLQADRGAVLLLMEDDGRGMPTPSSFQAGVGLNSIRRRVEALGGFLRIESQPGVGTCLRARFPSPC